MKKFINILTLVFSTIIILWFVGCKNAEENTSSEGGITYISDINSLRAFINNSEPKGVVIKDFVCTEEINCINTVDKIFDLNGHTITCNAGYFVVGSGNYRELIFCDSKGGAIITASGTSFLIRVNKRKMSIKNGITLNIETSFSGPLQGMEIRHSTIDELNAKITAKNSAPVQYNGTYALYISDSTIGNIYGGPYIGETESATETAYGIYAAKDKESLNIKSIGTKEKKVTFKAINKAGGNAKNVINGEDTPTSYPNASFETET